MEGTWPSHHVDGGDFGLIRAMTRSQPLPNGAHFGETSQQHRVVAVAAEVLVSSQVTGC